MLPLDGIKIIDFTRLLPGPLATFFMAQLGATIYKIESPNSIDYMRSFPPFIDEDSAYYHFLNAGKKSVSFDLIQDKAQLLALIKEADVLIEQFRPDMLKKFGLDYDQLKAINPALIYISLTGYGYGNQMSQKGGHDLNFLAMSGLLSLNKSADGFPALPAFQLADVAGGAYMLLNTVSLALLLRHTKKIGDYYDISMTDTVLPIASMFFAQQQYNPDNKIPFLIDGKMANYAIYRCKDGQFIALAALEPKFWVTFCDIAGKPEWKEQCFDPKLKDTLTTFFLEKNRDEWVDFFAEVDICISPVLTTEEVLKHPYFHERDAFSTITIDNKCLHLFNFPVKGFQLNKPTTAAEKLGESMAGITF